MLLPKVQGRVPSMWRHRLAPLWPFYSCYFIFSSFFFIIRHSEGIFFTSRSPGSEKTLELVLICRKVDFLSRFDSTLTREEPHLPRLPSRGRQSGVSANWTHIFLSITMPHARARPHTRRLTHTVILITFLSFEYVTFCFFESIIVLRCWVLDSNYYSDCCCYIISFRVDFNFDIISFYIAVIYIDFNCVLSKL